MTTPRKLIALIAEQVARHTVAATLSWRTEDDIQAIRAKAREHIGALSTFLPHGSGFDAGTTIDIEGATQSRIVFGADFHHMDEYGSYDGWTRHRVVVAALFEGFDIRITGVNKNDIKDYIGDVFAHALNANINANWNDEAKRFVYTLALDDDGDAKRAEYLECANRG